MRNNTFRKSMVIGIIVLFVGVAVVPSTANVLNVNISTKNELPSTPLTSRKTIYVDDDNTEGPWDGTLEHPFQNIQDGINNASNGDIIYVFNGTYNENIIINKTIDLIGEGRDTTIIDGVDGDEDGGDVVEVTATADGTYIDSFTITGGDGNQSYGDGIYLNGYASPVDRLTDVTIINCKVKDNERTGIVFKYVDNSNIVNCTSHNNGCNESVENGILLVNSSHNNIINCVSHDNKIPPSEGKESDGIELISYCNYNIIENCEVYNNEYAGIQINWDSNFNTIKNCEIYSNTNYGIIIKESVENTITNCDIHDTVYSNSAINDGFILDYEEPIQYSTSGSSNSGSNPILGASYGIYLSNSLNNNIVENNITNNQGGIYIKIDSSNNNIYHNNFIDNGKTNAKDWGDNNWDNGSKGNYWDDYVGIDLNGDGIGDIPSNYNIEPYLLRNKDNYPLIGPYPDAYNNQASQNSQTQSQSSNFQIMHSKNGLFFRWNSRKITVRYDMNITNAGNKTVNITTYLAQPDTHINQEIHGPINYYPNPNSFLTDRWGQKVAYYIYTLQPNHNMTLSWQANATVYSVRYILIPWKIKGAIPDDIKENFTSDEPMYKINDPFIQGIVNNVTGKIRNILFKAIKLHNYVTNNLEYVHDDRWDDAVTVLKQGHGSCSEYCYAFIALCRAAGIPARYNGGSIYKKEPPHIDRTYHRIVEIYLPSYEWVPIDVTWDDTRFKYFYFGLHINKLFTLTIGGGASEYLNWSYHYWQEVTPPSNDIIVNKSITWLRWEWNRIF